MGNKIISKIYTIIKQILSITPKMIYQWIIVETLIIWDRLCHRKVLVLAVEELGFIQFILPIVDVLKKKEVPISYYIATDYLSFDRELSQFNVSKNKRFCLSICSWLCFVNMLISPSIYLKGPKSAFKIQISHNLPLTMKIESYSKDLLCGYDVHFLTSPLHRDFFEQMLTKHHIETKDTQLINIGYPKSDALLQEVYKRDVVLDDLGLNREYSTVLYAPAWDPGASLRSFGEEVIEKLVTLNDVNIIVKLHPVSYTLETSPNFEFYTGGINWIEKLSRFEKNPNFRHVAEYSIDPLLAASDVMITDISSVAQEFIVLDRPVIYLDCPEFYENTLMSWKQDPKLVKANVRLDDGRNAGIIVKNLSELVDAVQRSLDNPNEFSEKRKALSKRLLYNPGKGSEAAAKAILDLLGL